MSNGTLLIAQSGVIVAGVVVVLLFNNARFAALDKRIDDLRSDIDHRFEDLIRYIDERFKNIEQRIERLQHPVVR